MPRATRGPLTDLVARHDGLLRALCRIGFALSVLAVLLLSLLPAERLPEVRLWDKLAHMIAYAEIAALGALGFPAQRATMAMLAGVAALGGAIEIGQIYVPGRSGDLLDFAVNCLGALAGYLAVRAAGRLWAAARG